MITLSFKEKKRIEEEKYNFPVLTQHPYTGEKHSVAKFSLNKAALAVMGYPDNLKECRISIGRDDQTSHIALLNTTGMETPNQYNINLDGTFNCKFLSKKLEKYYSSNPKNTVGFVLESLPIPSDEEVSDTIVVLIKDSVEDLQKKLVSSEEKIVAATDYPDYLWEQNEPIELAEELNEIETQGII